jgi:hypothetical protein
MGGATACPDVGIVYYGPIKLNTVWPHKLVTPDGSGNTNVNLCAGAYQIALAVHRQNGWRAFYTQKLGQAEFHMKGSSRIDLGILRGAGAGFPAFGD